MCKASPVSVFWWLLPKRQQWNQHFSVQESWCLYCCPNSPWLESYLLSIILLNSQRVCLWVMPVFSDIMSSRAGCAFLFLFRCPVPLHSCVTPAGDLCFLLTGHLVFQHACWRPKLDGQSVQTIRIMIYHTVDISGWGICEHTELGIRSQGDL